MINVYNKLIPRPLRDSIIFYRNHKKWFSIAHTVKKYYKDIPLNNEQKQALSYLKKNLFKLDDNNLMYLSDIVSKYEDQYKDSTVYFNDKKKLPFLIHQEKPLFFPKNYSPESIRRIYCQFMSEMDLSSPHVYCKNPKELDKRILLDCGVAEGLFPLTYIEKFTKIYLFECDPQWIEALNATFEPYKEKVTIIQKYVSNTNSSDTTTLDSYKDVINDNPLFIKMDIEGFEEKAIEGAKNILSTNNNTICAICTYHTPQAETNITKIMASMDYTPQYNQGYMIFHYEDIFTPPYLRRGVVRFYNNISIFSNPCLNQ